MRVLYDDFDLCAPDISDLVEEAVLAEFDRLAERAAPAKVELARATEAEKQSQLDRLADFQARHAEVAPAALRRLKEAAAGGGMVFEALMEAVRHCSLGQISEAFFQAGGQYRRRGWHRGGHRRRIGW